MTRDRARRIAEGLLLRSFPQSTVDCVELQDGLSVEYPFAWVFRWGPKLEHGKSARQMFGNAPILVDRTSGTARFLGTAYPIEWYVHAYESLGEARYHAGEWREFIARVYASELG